MKKKKNCTILIPKGNAYCHRKSSARGPRFKVSFEGLSAETCVNFSDQVHYVPGREREKSYQLELSLTLAPRSVTKISVHFERALLKWTEYPPDANHGFDINSAVISLQLEDGNDMLVPSHNTSTLMELYVQITCVISNREKWGECNRDKKHCCFHWELNYELNSGLRKQR